MNNTLNLCTDCPRNCKIDRKVDVGYCKSKEKIKIARASRHMWEEPCISGKNGSGTVFFSGCNLRCVYCQNAEINCGKVGKELEDNEVKDLFLKISKSGVHNINLVTPTHYLKKIINIISEIKEDLNIPIVYNCSGYENSELIKECGNIIDIFLTDFKYKSIELSSKYSFCPDYFEVAMESLETMLKLKGKPKFKDGLLLSGVIVRHLILPSHKNDSIDILSELYKKFGNDSFLVSLMSQYTPTDSCKHYPEINRRVTSLEYQRVKEVYDKLGFCGYVQEKSSADKNYIPDFYDEGEFLTL